MFQPITLFFTALLVIFACPIKAEDNENDKSIVLFQMLKHIDWSTIRTQSKPLEMCSLTQNEHSAAHLVGNKQAFKSGQRLVNLHYFYQIKDLSDYIIEFSCDIYYFDNVFSQLNIRHILTTAIQKNSISIGNGDAFLLQNGTLAFIQQDKNLTLRVNMNQANTNSLIKNPVILALSGNPQ